MVDTGWWLHLAGRASLMYMIPTIASGLDLHGIYIMPRFSRRLWYVRQVDGNSWVDRIRHDALPEDLALA